MGVRGPSWRSGSAEVLWVAMSDEVRKARAVRRMPFQEQWSKDSVGWVKHVPWHRYEDQEDADGDIPCGQAEEAEAVKEEPKQCDDCVLDLVSWTWVATALPGVSREVCGVDERRCEVRERCGTETGVRGEEEEDPQADEDRRRADRGGEGRRGGDDQHGRRREMAGAKDAGEVPPPRTNSLSCSRSNPGLCPRRTERNRRPDSPDETHDLHLPGIEVTHEQHLPLAPTLRGRAGLGDEHPQQLPRWSRREEVLADLLTFQLAVNLLPLDLTGGSTHFTVIGTFSVYSPHSFHIHLPPNSRSPSSDAHLAQAVPDLIRLLLAVPVDAGDSLDGMFLEASFADPLSVSCTISHSSSQYRLHVHLPHDSSRPRLSSRASWPTLPTGHRSAPRTFAAPTLASPRPLAGVQLRFPTSRRLTFARRSSFLCSSVESHVRCWAGS